MSDRLLRVDNRAVAHDGKETKRRSSAVRTLVPEEVASMQPDRPTPQRIDVAAIDAQKRLDDMRHLITEYEPRDRTWDQLAEAGLKIANREMTFCEAASDAAQVANGQMSEAQWERYREVMAVIKANRVEDRHQQGANFDPSKLSREQLEEVAKR